MEGCPSKWALCTADGNILAMGHTPGGIWTLLLLHFAAIKNRLEYCEDLTRSTFPQTRRVAYGIFICFSISRCSNT